MKDELIELLRDRFSGHELEVPDSVWEHVSGQLAATAGVEGLRKTLQEKFQAHEMDVDPSAWTNIRTQLGHGAAAGSPFSTAWIATGIVAVAITAGAILWNIRETQEPTATAPTETVAHQPVATLHEASVNTAEPVAPAAAASTGQVSVPGDKAAPAQASPVKATQTTPRNSTPAIGEVHKEAAALPVKASHNDPPGDLPETQPSTTGPSTAQVPQQDTPTPRANEPAVTGPTALDSTGDRNAHAPVDPAASATTTPNGDDPFNRPDEFNMFFPNTFTPNGDGDNDEFGIIVGPHLNAQLRIFSMNGSLVFETNDLAQWWNGHLPNGNIAEEGSYTCIVQVTDLDGRTHIKKKVISLYRTLNP